MLSSEFAKMLCRMEIEYRKARFAGEDISWIILSALYVLNLVAFVAVLAWLSSF